MPFLPAFPHFILPCLLAPNPCHCHDKQEEKGEKFIHSTNIWGASLSSVTSVNRFMDEETKVWHGKVIYPGPTESKQTVELNLQPLSVIQSLRRCALQRFSPYL